MVVERNFRHREVKSSSKINSKFTFEVTTAMEICKQYPPFGAKSYSDICPGIFVLRFEFSVGFYARTNLSILP